METREATEADIPAIVALLKLSLGESLMPKSERYWRWKHIENPFGRSPALLCWEGNTLVGVRAFMRWQWKEDKKIYSALRAVDTATHTEHQGKGIFKKLTLALVDFCKQQNDDFVFNTPNKQSTPGYIKMGWQEVGKLPIKLNLARPIGMIGNLFYNSHMTKLENSSLRYYLEHPGLESLIESQLDQTKNITTNVSKDYLKWRYLDVPVADYVAIGEEEGNSLVGLVIGRVKKTRLGIEFRVTDFFLKDQAGEGLLRQLKTKKKIWKVDYCTLAGTTGIHQENFLRHFSLGIPVGPVVTIRALGLTDLSGLKNFNRWSPSLGDLELF